MKKQRIISAAVSTAMLMSYAGAVPGIYQISAEETAQTDDPFVAGRMEFYTDLHEVDDSGYFEAAFEDYAAKVGNLNYMDDNYNGKCTVYISNRVKDNSYFLITFPEAKKEMYISFTKNDDEVKNKITKEIISITGGTRETDYTGSTALILADEIGKDKYDKVMELCQPYIDEGTIREVKYDPDSVKSYETHIRFDRLYYFDNDSLNRGYNFEDVAAFLKQKGEKCRVIKAYTNGANILYSVEPENNTEEERFRIAKLIKDEFGYEIDLTSLDYEMISDYKTENFIPATYTEPKNEKTDTVPEEKEADSDKAAETKPAADGNILYGDLNGDGLNDVTDLTLLSLHLIGDKEITDAALLEAADIQPDGKVNLSDLARFRQYLSKKISSIGRSPVSADITDSCKTVKAGCNPEKWYVDKTLRTGLMIASFEDYEKYIGSGSEEDERLAENGVEVNEEFFKNNRLAVMVDNSEGCNGVKFTLTAVKTDEEGNVHLYYDKFMPGMMTEIAGVVHYITVVPGNENKNTGTEVHFNVIKEQNDITGECMIMNSTGVRYNNHSEIYPSVSGMVTSMDQFNEEMDKYGIEPVDVIERFGISEEFFDDYFLIYHTDYASTNNPKNMITSVTLDYQNHLKMNVSRYTTVRYNAEGVPVVLGGAVEVYWFLAAAVPKSIIEPSEVASFDVESYDEQGTKAGSIYNQINERSVISNSVTEFKYTEPVINIIASAEEFESFNKFHVGIYSHLKDEFLTDDFFKDNMLFVINQPSECKNIRYNILNLSVTRNAELRVQVGKFINAEDSADADNKEWHLAAAIPRNQLVFEKDELSPRVSYKTEEALLGKFE